MKYGTKIRGSFILGPYEEGMTGLDFVRAGFDNYTGWATPMICQEKLDGWFGIVIRGDGDCYWENGWTQYGKLQAMLPTFNSFMPHGSILIGEVGYGTEFETALAEKNGFHRFIMYDTIMWNGEVLKDKTNLERFEVIQDLYMNSGYSCVETVDSPIVMADTRILDGTAGANREDAWNEFVRIYNNGGEGLILKDCDGHYVMGGKTTSMRKIKKFMTKDYVCLGFTKSVAPTYLEQGLTVSSMECGLIIDGKLQFVTQTSGFNFDWRKKFSEHPEQYVGRVVELGGNEIFKGGAMRHSSFLRFREDRGIEDCVL